MPRYVVLYHELPHGSQRPSHFDFMLEMGDSLWTWAVAEEIQPGQMQTAERLPDHRLEYLTYEGPISNDRGQVSRWDADEYVVVQQSPEQLTVQLEGHRLRGVMELQLHSNQAETAQRWSVSLRNT